jgi:molybdate-binding protein
VEHDALVEGQGLSTRVSPVPTVVVAGCDPAIGLLQRALREKGGVRLIALYRSSEQALRLLASGLVHAAGVHLSGASLDNAESVRRLIGNGYRLLRVADWETGLAVAGRARPRTEPARLARLRWASREVGSGARRLQDRLLQGRSLRSELLAAGHEEVAQMVRMGVAEAGVCIRLAADEARAGFSSLGWEAYDLCLSDDAALDPAAEALVAAVHSQQFRSKLSELPGYDTRHTGELARVA